MVGRMAAMAVVFGLGAVVVLWPLWVWGPTIWVGIYIGYLLGRVMAEITHHHRFEGELVEEDPEPQISSRDVR